MSEQKYEAIIYDEASTHIMTKEEQEEMDKLTEKMLKNPRIKKALKGLLKPLKRKGDKLIIKN